MKKSIFYSVSLVGALGIISSVNLLPGEGHAQVVKEKSKGERVRAALGFFGYNDKQIVASLATLRERTIESGHSFFVTDGYWVIASKPAEDYVTFYRNGLVFLKGPFFQRNLTLKIKGRPQALLWIDQWAQDKSSLSVQSAGFDGRIISGSLTKDMLAELYDHLMQARAEDVYDCALRGEILLTDEALDAMHAKGLSVRDVIDHIEVPNPKHI